MHIAAHSITDLRSAEAVLKALGVTAGMVFEVPANTYLNLYRLVREIPAYKRDHENTYIAFQYYDQDHELYISSIRIVPASRFNFHRYKKRLFRVLPPASSAR